MKLSKILLSSLAIIACVFIVVLSVLSAVLSSRFASASSVSTYDIVTDSPLDDAPLENVSISLPSNATFVVSQTQLYFETDDSQGGWSIVRFKFNRAMTFNDYYVSFYYSMFNGSNTMSMSWFLNGTQTAWLDVSISNQSIVPYDYFDSTYSQFSPHLQGTQFDEIGIRLYYGSSSPAWFQLFTFKVGKKDFTDYVVNYRSYLYDIITGVGDQNYNNGYNKGHAEGYDQGAAAGITNPITVFIQPIDSFLNTPIFGQISIGDILSLIIFVMVALVFIKMFAGG